VWTARSRNPPNLPGSLSTRSPAPAGTTASKPTNSGVSASEGPSTKRGKRTRAALVQSARPVFEESGFLKARITDIADRAGVAHGTFYTYFESKEAIFGEVVNALVGEMFAASHVGNLVHDGPVARIEAANRQYLGAYARNAQMLVVLDQVATFNDYFRQLRVSIRRVFVERAAHGVSSLQALGLADTELDPYTAASALGGMVEHFAYVWLALGEPADEDVAVDTLTHIWARGIGLRI
jgi:AcrR family transcriptional regulator